MLKVSSGAVIKESELFVNKSLIKKTDLVFVLSAVSTDCVYTIQTDLKKFSSDLKKELKELQKLENVRLRNPADRQRIVSFTKDLHLLLPELVLGLLLQNKVYLFESQKARW